MLVDQTIQISAAIGNVLASPASRDCSTCQFQMAVLIKLEFHK